MSSSANAEVIRPYSGVDELDPALEDLEVQVKGQGSWTADTTVVLQPEDFQPLGLSFRWKLTDSPRREALMSQLELAHVAADQVSLIGLLRSGLTKTVSVFLEENLGDLLEAGGIDSHEIPTRSRPRPLPGHAVTAEFYLVLNTHLEGNFPYPYRRGTWLSQKKVTFQSDDALRFEFEWESLDDDAREEMGLHKNSLLYVQCIMGLHEGESLSDCLRAYLDDDYKAALAQADSAVTSRLLQSMLVSDVVSEALRHSLRKLSASGVRVSWEEVAEKGVLGRLIQTLARQGSWAGDSMEASDLYEQFLLRPELIAETVADFFKLRQLGKAALKESE